MKKYIQSDIEWEKWSSYHTKSRDTISSNPLFVISQFQNPPKSKLKSKDKKEKYKAKREVSKKDKKYQNEKSHIDYMNIGNPFICFFCFHSIYLKRRLYFLEKEKRSPNQKTARAIKYKLFSNQKKWLPCSITSVPTNILILRENQYKDEKVSFFDSWEMRSRKRASIKLEIIQKTKLRRNTKTRSPWKVAIKKLFTRKNKAHTKLLQSKNESLGSLKTDDRIFPPMIQRAPAQSKKLERKGLIAKTVLLYSINIWEIALIITQKKQELRMMR